MLKKDPKLKAVIFYSQMTSQCKSEGMNVKAGGNMSCENSNINLNKKLKKLDNKKNTQNISVLIKIQSLCRDCNETERTGKAKKKKIHRGTGEEIRCICFRNMCIIKTLLLLLSTLSVQPVNLQSVLILVCGVFPLLQ